MLAPEGMIGDNFEETTRSPADSFSPSEIGSYPGRFFAIQVGLSQDLGR